jgi:hypothetical protein
MVHRSLQELGNRKVLENWGFDDKANLYETIKNLTHEEEVRCFLAAIVDQLMTTNRSLFVLRSSQSSENNHENAGNPVSDGIFHFLRRALNDKPIAEQLKLHCPSVRARKALAKSGLKFCSEVTRENLQGIKDCGVTTIHELEEWAKL